MGDLVSNIRIDEVVKIHKERRKGVDRDAIMTMVVKPIGATPSARKGGSGGRRKGEGAVFVIDPETQECLHYEPTMAWPKTKQVNVPREILEEREEVEVRCDLLDCGIDICSVDVRFLFAFSLALLLS